MKVILSIKPEFAEKILDGTKRFEFRKASFSARDVKTVVIYATKPIGKVVGEFDIDSVLVGDPKEIWGKTKNFAGINKRFFDEYFQDRTTAVAIAVGEVRRFEVPLDLNDFGTDIYPPQSFRYLPAESESQLALPM